MRETNQPLAEATVRGLFERYYPAVCSFFVRQGFSHEEAQDLAQETFARAFQAIGSLRHPSKTAAWLFSVAKNVSLNRLRRHRAAMRQGDEVPLEDEADLEEEVEADEPHLLEGLLGRERRELLVAAIRELPPRMRQVVLLRIVHGLKYREIAAVLQVSIDTVKSQLSQARGRLQALMGQDSSEM